MDYEEFTTLRQQHPAWRLLAAEHAPFIIGFLHLAFIASNRRAIIEADLTEQLEDYRHHLRQARGQDLYPRPAADYLRDWAHGQQAYLRRYFAPDGDDVIFDLTTASEQAIQWLASLGQRAFIGTESRLLTIIQMLREVVEISETDPQVRISALEARKRDIDAEIQDLQTGRFTPGDPRQVKERLFALEDNARRLLGDFRQIEENFRQLDRSVRERFAVSDATKGALIQEVFEQRDAIAESDQGKSFSAFWSLLMSPRLQDDLASLLESAARLEAGQDLGRDSQLARIQDDLLDAGQQVQRTSGLLTGQLRRFLDNKVWVENKRIMALIQDIQTQAMALQSSPPNIKDFARIEMPRVDLKLPLSRGLYRPTAEVQLNSDALVAGEADFDDEALYNVFAIDQARLHRQIEQLLENRSQVSLVEVCARFPIQQGLSEVIGYFQIASSDPHASIDAGSEQTLEWDHPGGWRCRASIPQVLFTRQPDTALS